MAGAGVLFAAMLFLGLAIASYTQTDPSASTAASGTDVRNWMGRSGAWAAERVLYLFGLSGLLLLPLLYVAARKLWRDVEEEDRETGTRWWRPIGLLLISIAALATVLALAFDGPGGTTPAGMGGLTGLLGAAGIEAIGARVPGGGWVIMALAVLCLIGGTVGVTRVFAIDWAQLLTLPRFFARMMDECAEPTPWEQPRRRRHRTAATGDAPSPAVRKRRVAARTTMPRRLSNRPPAVRRSSPTPAHRPNRPPCPARPRPICSRNTNCPASTCWNSRPSTTRPSSTRWRWNATPACSKTCSTISM